MATKQADEPLLYRLFFHPFRTIIIIALWLFMLIFIANVTAVAWYAKEPVQGLVNLKQATINSLEYTMIDGELSQTTVLAGQMAELAYRGFYTLFGMDQALNNFATDAAVSLSERLYQQRLLTDKNRPFILVAMQATRYAVIKLVLMITSLPVLLFAVILGTVDGLAMRTIRRVSGGRESSNLYHRAKTLHWFGMTLLISVYVIYPGYVNPQMIFLPYALLLALVSQVQWKYYKKYL